MLSDGLIELIIHDLLHKYVLYAAEKTHPLDTNCQVIINIKHRYKVEVDRMGRKECIVSLGEGS